MSHFYGVNLGVLYGLLIYNFVCVPSQNGKLAECLHPHQAIFFISVTSTLLGTNELPLCDPSQNGCLALLPHVQ